jgi:hypothetical protein
VAGALGSARIPFALIGASALTIHGVNRSTLDVDLLVTDRACLDRPTWSALESEGVSIDVRKGDLRDPLAGVVRFESQGDLPLDLVVGKLPWQEKILARARTADFAGLALPVLGPVELILLKLYAGGPQDAWDVQQLLAGPDQASLIAEVETELHALPPEASRLWKRILDPEI